VAIVTDVGAYESSPMCKSCGVDYYNLFKNNCKYAYAVRLTLNSSTSPLTHSPRSMHTSDLLRLQANPLLTSAQ